MDGCNSAMVGSVVHERAKERTDGEDLIICIAIWTLYKLWVPLLCDDLRVRSIAPQNEFRFIDR